MACILLVSYATGQDCALDFQSPVRHTTVLSGSYGEPRTRHFHAGIDFKQYNGVPRDTIYAVEDGFVSRINVQPDGYGNAVYIEHACGKTSVYAHLHDFAPFIRSHIDHIRYQKRLYAVSHYPDEDLLPVKKGQPIGILGNTGRSSGPHLHFEIRETSSEKSINPALFGFKPGDDIPPVIGGIMIYELGPKSRQIDKTFYPTTGKSSIYELSQNEIITNGLRIGIGIRAFDQMNGARNHNGIYRLEMRVNEKTTFSFSLDSIDFELDHFIHSHMDYDEKMNNRYVTKCYKEPGNALDFYEFDEAGGIIYPYEFKSLPVEIIVSDIEGNQSSIAFSIRRSDKISSNSSKNPIDDAVAINPEDSLSIILDDAQIIFSPHTFTQPVALKIPDIKEGEIDLRQPNALPAFRHIKVRKKMKEIAFPRHKYHFSIYNTLVLS